MLLLGLLLLTTLLFPSHVLAKTRHYIDDTNSTAWSFAGSFSYLTDPMAYDTSATIVQPGVYSSGKLTFQGSSVDIYGVAFDRGQSQCAVDFTWPSGNSTFVMSSLLKTSHNISYAHASGFNPGEVSSISSAVRRCSAVFDYAIVTVEDDVVPSLIGPIVGGVVGAVVLALLIVGIWAKRQHRKTTSPQELSTSLPTRPKTAFMPNIEAAAPNHMGIITSDNTATVSDENQATTLALAPSNSLSTLAREKQERASRADDTESRILTQSIISADDSILLNQLSKGEAGDRPMSFTSSNPAVQARLEQLQAEIQEIHSRDALPPPY
ncbi:hypothetical protein DL96DRAFT_1638975 [Flagelloscypha sp. PMI_526]|nr:hypothetical protein DL96DRAFT_1638975 [Flagelloscypha sp. PMI_526]